jgi:hypothetical protein
VSVDVTISFAGERFVVPAKMKLLPVAVGAPSGFQFAAEDQFALAPPPSQVKVLPKAAWAKQMPARASFDVADRSRASTRRRMEVTPEGAMGRAGEHMARNREVGAFAGEG